MKKGDRVLYDGVYDRSGQVQAIDPRTGMIKVLFDSGKDVKEPFMQFVQAHRLSVLNKKFYPDECMALVEEIAKGYSEPTTVSDLIARAQVLREIEVEADAVSELQQVSRKIESRIANRRNRHYDRKDSLRRKGRGRALAKGNRVKKWMLKTFSFLSDRQVCIDVSESGANVYIHGEHNTTNPRKAYGSEPVGPIMKRVEAMKKAAKEFGGLVVENQDKVETDPKRIEYRGGAYRHICFRVFFDRSGRDPKIIKAKRDRQKRRIRV